MEEQKTVFEPKMKECPWCGEKNCFQLHDMDTSYFLVGLKGKLSEMPSISSADLQNNMKDFPVIPITCKKCGYTVLLNKVWSRVMN